MSVGWGNEGGGAKCGTNGNKKGSRKNEGERGRLGKRGTWKENEGGG